MQYLYRHYDCYDNLLYVGITLCALKRIRQHRSDSEWFKLAARIEIETCLDRKEAMQRERIAIQTEFPIYNKAYNKKMKPTENKDISSRRVSFYLDSEAIQIIEDSKRLYGANPDRIVSAILRDYKDHGYSLYHRSMKGSMKVDVDEECEMIVEAIHMVEGLELNSVIDRLLKDFKSNGYKFKESEE